MAWYDIRLSHPVWDMAATRLDSEPGPTFSMGPEDDQQLSVELLIGQLVEQASVIMTAQQRLRRLLTSVVNWGAEALVRRARRSGRDGGPAASGVPRPLAASPGSGQGGTRLRWQRVDRRQQAGAGPGELVVVDRSIRSPDRCVVDEQSLPSSLSADQDLDRRWRSLTKCG